jgi:hypothetical protein
MDQFAAKPNILVGDLTVYADNDGIRGDNRKAHSSLRGSRKAKDAKRNPKYIRMLTDGGAFSADMSSGALIFDGTEIDIDTSPDGKRGHHFFGKKCFHNKRPFETAFY